jgi:hypothetical protein
VKVFPEPVYPYANIVPLYPSIALSTTGFAILSNISCYVVSEPKTSLNSNA